MKIGPQMYPVTRRTAMAGLVAAPALLAFGRAGAALGGGDPFAFGVASGEPTADGMVLWTRLVRRPLEGDGGMSAAAVPVRWEMFADDQATRPVRSGNAVADPAWGHSVHVEVAGLAPDRPYWFRFVADGVASPLGRTRTTPALGVMVDRFRFCFGSCQKYETGHYGAWANAVADDPDLIVFLGDYIYEGNPATGTVRTHLNPEPMDVAGYRIRYATYRLDPLLQAAHAIAPWAVTWDDHEVANDYAAFLDQHNGDPKLFERRRAAAYQVYWEFMPLRRRSRPQGAAMQLYRTLDWGALAQFQIIDDRQYRSGRACQPPGSVAAHRDRTGTVAYCAELDDPKRSLLGWEQERWLHDALERSRARWNILAQQTQMTPYPRRSPDAPDDPRRYFGVDAWDGYAATRARVVDRWAEARVSNPLAIGGDIHSFVASDIRRDDAIVAPSFVGGSITSLGGDPLLAANIAGNASYRFARNDVRGYGRIDLTPAGSDVVFRAVADPADPRTTARDLARFRVESGRGSMTTV